MLRYVSVGLAIWFAVDFVLVGMWMAAIEGVLSSPSTSPRGNPIVTPSMNTRSRRVEVDATFQNPCTAERYA